MADASMIIREDGHYVVTDHDGNSSVWTSEKRARKWLKKQGALKKPDVTLTHSEWVYTRFTGYAWSTLLGVAIGHILLHIFGYYG